MIRRRSRREKLFLATAAGAAAVFLLSRWVLLPLLDFASGAAARIDEGLAVLTAYQGVVSRETGLREETVAIDGALEGFSAFFLPGDTPPLAGAALEARLKELADRAGLKVVSGKILGHQQKEPFLEIPVQIVATGSIAGFRDFILLAESSEVFIGIRELTIRSLSGRPVPRGRGREEGADIQATMTLAGLIPS